MKRGSVARVCCAWFAFGCWLWPHPARADEPERSPEPAWVEAIAPDFEQARTNELGGDSFTLLLDTRVRLDGSRQERYERRVRKALTSSGVERLAELLVEFESEYEKLVLHRIELRRGTQVIDQTKTARVRLVAQESDLERRMYNGGVTAFVVLSDVRAGDVVDVAYSVIGATPALGGRYADGFQLSGSDPIRQRHIEIQAVGQRPALHGKVMGAPSKGQSSQPIGPDWVDLRDIPAQVAEDRVPAGLESTWLEVSEFASWQEVATWGARLYPTVEITPDLRQQAEALAGPNGDPAQAALKILRFVQDDVRYLAINNEDHALRPHVPGAVLSQRFGDCKDKTYLLLHLLRARGIEAAPMLVHSRQRAFLAEHAPTPFSFDHVILRATIGGKFYYLDATHGLQGGELDTQVAPDFRYGLVLAASTTELEQIPSTPLAVPGEQNLTKVTVGPDGAATLDVSTDYEGEQADDLRGELASRSLKELADRYANYYETEYSNIDVLTPPEVHDDRPRNLIHVAEHYRVPNFWRDEQRQLYTETIGGYLKPPHTVRRTLPLALSHPVWITQKFEVVLPFESSVDAQHHSAGDGIVKFSRDIRNAGPSVTASFEYRSFAPSVPVDKVGEHIKALQQARQWNTLNLEDESRDQQTGARPQRRNDSSMFAFWVVGGVALTVLVWPAALGVRGLRRRRAFKRRQSSAKGETPGSPQDVASLAAADAALSKVRCSCGKPFGSAEAQWSTLRFEGAVLHAGRITCPECDDSRCRYFKVERPT